MNSVEQQRPAFSRLAHFMVRLLAFALFCFGPMAAGPGMVSAADIKSADGGGSQPITLNFKDADIDSVVGAFGHLLNRTFIIDPRVRGKITVETARPLLPQASIGT